MMGTLAELPTEEALFDSFDVAPPETDEALLLSYRARGDWDDFAQLVGRYERELYSYLRRYLGSEHMAEDVFQATFLQVHLKCEQFEEGRRFRPWLYTIATNQAIDAQRRNRRHRMVSLDRSLGDTSEAGGMVDMLVSDEPSPQAEFDRQERREFIRRGVEQLAEPLRMVVVLVYYQGLKYREAAEVLEIPVGTVKSRLHSAIGKLNEAWQDAYASEG